MKLPALQWAAAVALIIAAPTAIEPADAPNPGPIKVEIRRSNGEFQLYRGGRPYHIRGAVYWGDPKGTLPLKDIADRGANSVRSGGLAILDEAARLGMTVTVNLPIKMESVHKINYDDPQAVRRQFWSGHWPANRPPAVEPLRVDGKRAADNVSLKPASRHTAAVKAVAPQGDPLRFTWEIMPEVARAGYAGLGEHRSRPMPALIVKAAAGELTFIAPQAEGPYRVFVFVRDEHGAAATANIPFCVAATGQSPEAERAGTVVCASDPARLARLRATKMPEITRPVSFDTPEGDAIAAALEVFPPDNPWNVIVADWPVHPNSKNLVASVGVNKPLRYNADMAYIFVPPDQKRVEVRLLEGAGESDKGPYPVPENVPIEGWPRWFTRHSEKPPTLAEVQRRPPKYVDDRHAIVVDPVNRISYEFFTMGRTSDGWAADQASIFDLKSNKLRPDGWTSSDAAGLPLYPAVVRYDELQRGEIEHALRVTIRKTRRAYVAPATHYASRNTNVNLPRMGERFRLRADFDVSGFSPEVKTILKALKKYGMFCADNGIEWAISVAPDPRIPDLSEELRKVKGGDFEVVTPSP